MLLEAGRGAGVNVTEQADFERNAFVENVLCQVSELHRPAVCDGNVVDQARAVTDAVSAAVLNSLPDGFFSEALARMNGNVEVLSLDVVKRVYMFFRRIAAFLAREVESNDSSCTKIDGEFGHFQRNIHVAHRANDQARLHTEISLAAS